MNTLLVIGLIVTFTYFCIQLARQEAVEDFYEDAIIDVEGRLDWARTRSFFPFGMKAQMDVSNELLRQAKTLWQENKWKKAYNVARQSQAAIDKAQSIYISGITTHRQSDDNSKINRDSKSS